MKLINIFIVVIILSTTVFGAETFTRNGIGGGGGIFNPSISPYNSDLRLTTSDMGGVFRTTNGGDYWELINFNQLSGMHNTLSPIYFKDKIYWNKGSNLYLSENEGKSWNLVENVPWTSSATITEIIAVDDKGIFLIVSSEGVWIFDETWKTIEKNINNIVVIDEIIYGFDNSNNLLISKDFGNTWETQNSNVFKKYSILSLTGGKSGDNISLFISIKNLGILKSIDEGDTWELIYYNFEPLTSLQMANNQIETICGYQDSNSEHEVWCSYNEGKNWNSIFNLIGERLNVERSWIQETLGWWYYITNKGFYVSKGDSKKMYISTQGELFYSSDSGKNWKIAYSNMQDNELEYAQSNGLEVTSVWDYYVSPYDEEIQYIAYTDIGFAKSVDGGKTWKNSVSGSPWRNTFYDIEFDSDDENIMYAAASSKHDIPYWTAVTVPTSSVNKGGVLISKNKGNTWEVLGNNLPNRPVTDLLLISESESKKLFATLYGEGVYMYDFDKKTWTKKSNGLGLSGNMHVLKIEKSPTTNNIYVLITAIRSGNNFYQQGGIWKSEDNGETWKRITSSGTFYWPTDFEISSQSDEIIYMTAATAPQKPNGGVFKTENGGSSWKTIFADSKMGELSGVDLSYDHTMEIYLAENSEILYVGSTSHGLFYSKDDGDSWIHVDEFPFKTITNIKHNPLNSNELIICTLGAGVFTGPDFD